MASGLSSLTKWPIVPTERAAWIAAGIAPIALLIAALAPQAWIVGPFAGALLLAAIVFDAVLAGRFIDYTAEIDRDVEVGQTLSFKVNLDVERARSAEVSLAFDPRLGNNGRITFPLAPGSSGTTLTGEGNAAPTRRGSGPVERIWLRWQGPLGLAVKQIDREVDHIVRVWPDLSPVRSKELQSFLRDAQNGLIARRIRGEGTQFEALSEYESGMDRRRIDWKASARHTRLYARENESERNNQIVFAIDCGQSMCEPVDGLPRIDRAVSAALTASYVALKGGDKVSLFGFAQRPQVMTPFIHDARSFHRFQAAAASLDYTNGEPNFTLALSTLTAKLNRRALIVLFSDFADPTSAEMMIESISRLVDRHLVLFVTIADTELERFIADEPRDMTTLARSVTADTLSRQRSLVLERLRHMGVDVIEAPWAQIGYRLIDRYLIIKNSEAIG
ncbi:MAG: DUF58 domain-containing protein [Pseudomonadota bacterium]